MVVALIIFSILVVMFFWLIFPSLRRHKDRIELDGLYIAHRGLHDISKGIPENSLAAFRAAVQNGFAIENDIHLTRDGKVVVFHDDDLERMCGVKGKVEEKTLAELKKMRLAGTNEQIPTLEECLAVVDGKVSLLVEFKVVKSNSTALCKAANSILSNYSGKYFIQSFFPSVLFWYKLHRKDICRGQLSSAFSGEAFYKKVLACLLTNFIARPDFVSYEHTHAKHPMRRLVTYLGAFPIGWTFRSKNELELGKKSFKTYIFENFVP